MDAIEADVRVRHAAGLDIGIHEVLEPPGFDPETVDRWEYMAELWALQKAHRAAFLERRDNECYVCGEAAP